MPADALLPFHPIVRQWFTETLGEPSAPQRAGWPAIAQGDDTLILAPTGTGKTLAAFLWELNALITDGLEGPLANAVQDRKSTRLNSSHMSISYAVFCLKKKKKKNKTTNYESLT